MWRITLLLALLTGCGMADRGYVLDGVPVTLENNKGPKIEHLTQAVRVYRDAARERWELSAKQDRVAWRSLREIVWTDRAVMHRANYDAEMARIEANWLDCALDVPFFEALTEHYAGTGYTADDFAWAEELRADNVASVCTGDAGNGLWPW